MLAQHGVESSLGENVRILLIDDDKTIRESLAFVLEQEGYVVDFAENGEEAIAKTQTNTYHLAIVDWRLPDVEGTKLLSQMRVTIPRMMKIMLTGYPSMDNAISAVNEGADAFLVKPVELDDLLEKIRDLLRLRESEKTFTEDKIVSFIETRVTELLDSEKTEKTSGLKE
jgi:DNA-binding response OmpR family regulator